MLDTILTILLMPYYILIGLCWYLSLAVNELHRLMEKKQLSNKHEDKDE